MSTKDTKKQMLNDSMTKLKLWINLSSGYIVPRKTVRILIKETNSKGKQYLFRS